MRFIIGLILGVALTIGGAYVHDNFQSSASTKPLVNWTTAAELQQSTFDYLKEQFGRVKNWVTSQSQ